MAEFSAGRDEKFTAAQWLATEECCTCRMLFAMPSTFQAQARQNRDVWFYCPNGHRQHYTGDSMETKLRNAEAKLTAQRDQLEAAVHEAESVRVALLRDRQRFANGVCPCCNRSFENVRRHMETKHPDYDATKVAQHGGHSFACSCGRKFETVRGLRTHQGHMRGDNWAAPGVSRWSAHLTRV